FDAVPPVRLLRGRRTALLTAVGQIERPTERQVPAVRMDVRFGRPRDEVEVEPALVVGVVQVRSDVAEIDVRPVLEEDADAFIDAVHSPPRRVLQRPWLLLCGARERCDARRAQPTRHLRLLIQWYLQCSEGAAGPRPKS